MSPPSSVAKTGVPWCQAREPVRIEQAVALEELDLVADGNLAALDDARQHAALALQLGPKAVAQLVHPVARVADHRDLELGLAGAQALADRPLLDIGSLNGDVLANRARLDVHRVEVLLGNEEDLTL